MGVVGSHIVVHTLSLYLLFWRVIDMIFDSVVPLETDALHQVSATPLLGNLHMASEV